MRTSNILFICLLMVALSVQAGPTDYVFTPHVERGESELDIHYGVASSKGGVEQKATAIGLGYGVTDRWFTEGILKQKTAGGKVSTYAEWENRLVLTEEGQYPLDVGIVAELEAPFDSADPWEMKFGPLLQKKSGPWQLNGNLIFEHAFRGADEHGVPRVVNLLYQWQVRYRGDAGPDVGMQGFGELGQWNQWSRPANQRHQMGPALFGKLQWEQEAAIKYKLVWLLGVNAAAPDHNLHLQLEYEF